LASSVFARPEANEPTPVTTEVVLLGHPVAHSLSPRMQNAAFAAAGLDWTYVLRDVLPEELEVAVREVEYANVTAPYKLDVARILGSELPSVNTIVRGAGLSTDTAILRSVGAVKAAAIVGDGGAAAAFRHALPAARVFSRRGEWPPDVGAADLVIHATPVRDEVLFELRPGQTLVDLPYPRTATAEAAAAAGARVLDGLEVLVAQGAASFELWTAVRPPVDVMRRALGLT
jgi:shikimate dehydrogenase